MKNLKLILFFSLGLFYSCRHPSKPSLVGQELSKTWTKSDTTEVIKTVINAVFEKNPPDTIFVVKNKLWKHFESLSISSKMKLKYAEIHLENNFGVCKKIYSFENQKIDKSKSAIDLINFVHTSAYAMVEMEINQVASETFIIGKSGDEKPWKILDIYKTFY